MLTILHAADLHLDAPFASLAPEQARRRRAEQRELLERLAALARTQQADLVLRIYEAGLVEPGLEKVSILGECRILLKDGRVLHGLLENGFLGLENTLMRIPEDLQDELQGILNEFRETGEALYGG